MKKGLFFISCFSVLLVAHANATPKYGPKAQPISSKTNLEYFQKNDAPDYWALSPYYVSQETPRGCSAANLTMILNASRNSAKLSADEKLITFSSFVNQYADEAYRKAIYGKGTLDLPGENFSNRNLTRLLNEAFKKLKINATATLTVAPLNQREKAKKEFLQALKENEKSSKDFIFASYMQGKITGDPDGGPHVATVAAFDEKKNLVLLMDSDREWYEPYWTSFDDFFDSIMDPRADSRKELGWIVVKVK